MGYEAEKSMDYAINEPHESPMSGGAKSLNPLMQSLKQVQRSRMQAGKQSK